MSPTFTVGNFTFVGVEGKVGILGPKIVAGQENKYMWHFWGKNDELFNKPFRVEVIELKTGEKHPVLLEHMGTPDEIHVWEYPYLAGPNNGANAHSPSGMKFLAAGKWKLDIFLGNAFFESIVLRVE